MNVYLTQHYIQENIIRTVLEQYYVEDTNMQVQFENPDNIAGTTAPFQILFAVF